MKAKETKLEKIAESTLAKIVSTREQWLSLHHAINRLQTLAKKSLEFIDGIHDSSSLENTCGYHLACDWTFTDISKLERAKTTLANSGKKLVAEGETDVEGNIASATPAKVSRTTTRLSIGNLTTQPSYLKSFNVLPEICLICKRLDITDLLLY